MLACFCLGTTSCLFPLSHTATHTNNNACLLSLAFFHRLFLFHCHHLINFLENCQITVMSTGLSSFPSLCFVCPFSFPPSSIFFLFFIGSNHHWEGSTFFSDSLLTNNQLSCLGQCLLPALPGISVRLNGEPFLPALLPVCHHVCVSCSSPFLLFVFQSIFHSEKPVCCINKLKLCIFELHVCLFMHCFLMHYQPIFFFKCSIVEK